MCRYVCGVEGGSTSTEVVILSLDGKECSKVVGPHVNQWTLGVEAAVERALGLIEMALNKAKLPLITKFLSLGLALSGVDSEENSRDIENEIRRTRPNLAEHIYVCNDCQGTLFSVTEKGGIVLIAGTGSNCKLICEDLSSYGVGGYGHMLGDEGSAFWIVHRAIKTYLDDDEGLVLTPHDTSSVKRAIFDYFGLQNNVDLLEPHYHFEKSYYSGLCQKLAELARSGDALCQHIFYKAGFFLAAHVMAVLRKADPQWRMNPKGVSVVCRGGVFHSWDLLEIGFRDRIVPDIKTRKIVTSLRLMLLTSPVAVGAALLAAHVKLNLTIPRNETQQLLVEFHS